MDFREPDFATLYRAADAMDLGLPLADFRQALEQLGQSQLPAQATTTQITDFYRRLHLKDLALAIACSQGSATAWELFGQRFRQRLYAAALRLARNQPAARELADSLCGDLFVSRGHAAGKLATYTGRGPLESWLYATLTQTFIDRYRSQRRELSRELSFDEQLATLHTVCAIEPCPVDPRLHTAIQEAFHALCSEDRYLLASYYFDQRTLAEIAATLDVHESTISRRIRRLTRGLRTKIARRLREKGMTVRQIQETFQTDVRDLALDLGSDLLRGAGLAGE